MSNNIPVEEHEGSMDLIFEKPSEITNVIPFPSSSSKLVHLERKIWVTFEVEGIHCYPAAKDIEGVQFLQYPHRHMFKFLVEISVQHEDREIEFILFKRWLQSLYKDGVLQANYKSCEMLAHDLVLQIDAKYPKRFITVTVSEDNENGATISYRTLNG